MHPLYLAPLVERAAGYRRRYSNAKAVQILREVERVHGNQEKVHAVNATKKRVLNMRNQYKSFANSAGFTNIKQMMTLLGRNNYNSFRERTNPRVYSNDFNNATRTPTLKQSFKNRVREAKGGNLPEVKPPGLKFSRNLFEQRIRNAKTKNALNTLNSNLLEHHRKEGAFNNLKQMINRRRQEIEKNWREFNKVYKKNVPNTPRSPRTPNKNHA